MRKLKIGRLDDNDIVISDTSVSRNHAEISIENENTFYITDLNSTNGTFVNGNRLIGTKKLEHNDILKVGSSLVPWRNYINQKENQTKIQETNETYKPEKIAQPASVDNSINEKILSNWMAILSGTILFLFIAPIFTWSNFFGEKTLSGIDFINELLDKKTNYSIELIYFRYYTLILSSILIGIISLLLLLINLKLWKNISPTISRNLIISLFICSTSMIVFDIFLFLDNKILNENIGDIISFSFGSGIWITFILSFLLYITDYKTFFNALLPKKNILKQATFWMPIIMLICFISNSNGWFNLENEKLDPSGFQLIYFFIFQLINEVKNNDVFILYFIGISIYFILNIIILFIQDFKSEIKLFSSWTTLVLLILLLVFLKKKDNGLDLENVKIGVGYFIAIIANIILLVDLYSLKAKRKNNGN